MSKKARNHLTEVDRRLGAVIERVGPCRLKPHRDRSPFAALSHAIVYQQLNGKAASAIWGRVVDLMGGERRFTAERFLGTKELALRSAGLSAGKMAAITDLAEKKLSGVVPNWSQLERMEDDEIVARLTQVRGIGPWTVEMLLIFGLGREDVLPATDYGVRQGFSIVHKLDELPTPKELVAFGERWRPYRSIASWYLWRATDELRS